MKKLAFLILALVIMLAGVLTACGSPVNDNSSGGQQQSQQQSQDEDNDNSAIILGDDSWEFSDIPEYPGADEAYKIRGEEPGEPPIIVENEILISNDSIEDVADYYRSAMANEGWEETFWGEITSGFIGSFTKPGDAGAAVGIATTSEGTTIITLDKRYPKS